MQKKKKKVFVNIFLNNGGKRVYLIYIFVRGRLYVVHYPHLRHTS